MAMLETFFYKLDIDLVISFCSIDLGFIAESFIKVLLLNGQYLDFLKC